jgi:phytoene synthase
MSSDTLLASLALPQRLALSYAPRRARAAILGVLCLEQRLGSILGGSGAGSGGVSGGGSGGGEPMIAQIKLAWWRGRLSEPAEAWPSGEPLLDHLRGFDGDVARLVPLVDGYEALLEETFDTLALTVFLRGTMEAWAAVSDASNVRHPNKRVEQAARELAGFDLAGRLTAESELAVVAEMSAAQPWQRIPLARELRPLAVLHALARRARRKGQRDLLDGAGAMGVAMRVGLLGR